MFFLKDLINTTIEAYSAPSRFKNRACLGGGCGGRRWAASKLLCQRTRDRRQWHPHPLFKKKMESDSDRSDHSASNSSYEVEDYSPPPSPEAGDNSGGRTGPEPYQFEPRAQRQAEAGAAAAETGAMLDRAVWDLLGLYTAMNSMTYSVCPDVQCRRHLSQPWNSNAVKRFSTKRAVPRRF